MTRYSANLGFLWTEHSLPEAIRCAAKAGFDAVEFHWPYETPAQEVGTVLAETGLSVMGINTLRGDTDAGENGLSALPGRDLQARQAIDQAIEYASAIGAHGVHVMAGFAFGQEAHNTFTSNLRYACEQAAGSSIKILIEPLNSYDAPGYFLSTTAQAVEIIEEVGENNLKLMFDCYHVQLMEGDLTHRLQSLLPHIGHIQFASVPDRGPPDGGEICYRYLFNVIAGLGYDEPLGAEYKPAGATGESIDWLKSL